jgi:hypothetical protein
MPRRRNIGDDVLLNAVRQRILDEVSAKQHHAASVINNYGGGGHHAPAGGIQEQMSNVDPELYDYMVEIGKRDLPPSEEHMGKSPGWDKTVRRYRTSKDEPKGKKKAR